MITRKRKLISFYLPLFLLTLGTTGCNLFDFMDNPSGDVQYLSAARACFDQGDLTCALDYYGRLSTEYSDTNNAESAFAILDQNGATMANLVSAIGNGQNGGKILTSLSDKLSTIGTGESVRIALYSAFTKTTSINDANLRGLVRFTSAMAIVAVALAEINGSNGVLDQTDIVTDATTCINNGLAGCAVGCSGSIGSSGTLDLESGQSSVEGSVTLDLIDAGIEEIVEALGSSELGSTGKFSSGTSSFASALDAFEPQTSEGCYRYALISNGIGN